MSSGLSDDRLKNIDHFFSEVTFTLVISDKEQNTQMYRESWKEGITKPYYEDTRDPDNYYKTENNTNLFPIFVKKRKCHPYTFSPCFGHRSIGSGISTAKFVFLN